ncbi:MAG: DUF488 family protein [Corynebacterium humireducens]|jgi:uncharacterized protein YeaO (DUF488 family)|uniref:DUF488 family protein n=1 Tax=Corynebacterium humireducens TaxID=1223514 RepID=A0A7X6SW89_9CORY|nr:DUF488 family protein [Corynebacterium humireducens]
MIHTAKVHDVLRGDATVHGRGVLTDRLWPRGVAKADMEWAWLKNVAPSTELRKWYGHDPEKWTEFRKRYRAELDELAAEGQEDVEKLLQWAEDDLTLLYGAADREHNQAIVLAEWLTKRLHKS